MQSPVAFSRHDVATACKALFYFELAAQVGLSWVNLPASLDEMTATTRYNPIRQGFYTGMRLLVLERSGVMQRDFDVGYSAEPFSSLVGDYPGEDVYPPGQFRVEWGPIFHRGRLDGSARVLVIGQDPAQHETVVRRILVGEAGRRVQGLLGKLGILNSHVLINAYLYSVYGSVRATTRRKPGLVDYRNQWIDAIMGSGNIEAVLAMGKAAQEAWEFWKATPTGQASTVPCAAVTHPTQPESSSKGDRAKLAQETKKLLANWNKALQTLSSSVLHPDEAIPLILYGETWAEGDRLPIPERDFPPGLPAWMHQQDGWAVRKGTDELSKRRNITITVPKGVVA